MGNINIYGVLHNDTPEGIIAKAKQIKDDRINKLQEDINKDVHPIRGKFEEGMEIKAGDLVTGSDNRMYLALVDTTEDPTNSTEEDGIYTVFGSDVNQHYEDNPEYIEVTLDADGKILEGIKEDGTKYFPNKIQHGEIYEEFTDNPEYIEVITDSEGKVIEGITVDGQKYLGKPSNQDEKILTEINEVINTKLDETDTKINQLEEDINKNVLTIELDNRTGELIATCGAPNAAFQTGRIDEKTGEIILEFEY